MKTLTLNIPESIKDRDLKMYIAGQLFEQGILSSGQAANFVGVNKKEFIENIAKYGVSIFGETSEDIIKIVNG